MTRILAGFILVCLVLYLAFLVVSIVLAILGQVIFLVMALTLGIVIGLFWAASSS